MNQNQYYLWALFVAAAEARVVNGGDKKKLINRESITFTIFHHINSNEGHQQTTKQIQPSQRFLFTEINI